MFIEEFCGCAFQPYHRTGTPISAFCGSDAEAFFGEIDESCTVFDSVDESP